MSKTDHYKNLLLKETKITQEIAISKIVIEENFKSYISPKNLYGYFEEKLEDEFASDISGEFELKKYLISLSLDLIYEKVASSLLKNSGDNNKSLVDWQIIAKTLVDKLYINNKSYLTDIVSEYVDKGIKKWTNK